ncbi:hypothetical protein VDGD_20859 [Verticillium dahliae]|nr:hypothetical protein VDGD_20859 [Verticillium dahliae]
MAVALSAVQRGPSPRQMLPFTMSPTNAQTKVLTSGSPPSRGPCSSRPWRVPSLSRSSVSMPGGGRNVSIGVPLASHAANIMPWNRSATSGLFPSGRLAPLR